MSDHILLRRAYNPNEVNIAGTSSGHQNNITGDGTSVLPEWNQLLSSQSITYDASTRKCRVYSNGFYLLSVSLPLSNFVVANDACAGWFHMGTQPAHEPFLVNCNPYLVANQAGSVPGGGSNIMAVVGTHITKIDINQDPFIWINVKIGGNATKNVTMLYDAFFSVIKLA